jgi:hypothetical protein
MFEWSLPVLLKVGVAGAVAPIVALTSAEYGESPAALTARKR